MSKCRNCSGTGESYDIRLLRAIDCDECHGLGIIQSHKESDYEKNSKKRFSKRVAKLGRDFEIKEEDER